MTPAKLSKGIKKKDKGGEEKSQTGRRAAMTWAQRLKRVLNIDIETCSACGGAVRVVACIEDPVVIKKIPEHLENKGEVSCTSTKDQSTTSRFVRLVFL